MAESQNALMRKAEAPSELAAAQYVKMAAQPEGVDAQAVKMTEYSTKVAELQGARQDARTGGHVRRREPVGLIRRVYAEPNLARFSPPSCPDYDHMHVTDGFVSCSSVRS